MRRDDLRGGNHCGVTHTFANAARLWYNGALCELQCGDFLRKAHLKSIQTIAILSSCNGNFGQVEREQILLSVAIAMARCLNMHKLAEESRLTPNIVKMACWKLPQDRALGRRLWWTLVICDWYVRAGKY